MNPIKVERSPVGIIDMLTKFYLIRSSPPQLEGFDAKALRAFRVLRPLRLVSGVPSLQVVCLFVCLCLNVVSMC